ncbi:MAG TPA: pyridoxamine 5'-phosphate oxidase [Desulfuromonadales bacterium]|nr:pyridoxamine 5'-phosphate oxidase [Desulfuromonadales bacterium]
MNKLLNERVKHYLQQHNVATLATCYNNVPSAAAVFYVNDGFTLYFLSSPTSRHCCNLAHNQQVAVTIQENYSDWLDIKGVQMEGSATEISGAEQSKARRIYAEKFPVTGLLSLAPAAVIEALAKVAWYRIVPQRIYFIDNSRGLGHRDELVLDV